MATTGTEKYSRIVLTLVKSGTKLTRKFLEKRVHDLSPSDKELTVDEFLQRHRAEILGHKTGKNKRSIFFPPPVGSSSTKTDLEKWDLYMFCFILLETCDLKAPLRMYVEKLQKMRNKLCHMKEPVLEDGKYEDYHDKLQTCFSACLAEINEQDFTAEIQQMVSSFKTGPLSIEDTIKQIYAFFHMDYEQRKILEKLSDETKDMNEKLEKTLSKLDEIQSRLPGVQIDVPGIDIVIEVKNCSSDNQKVVADILVKLFNDILDKKSSLIQGELPNCAMHTIREAVRQTFEDFLTKGRHIVEVEQKCVMLTVKCNSVSSFADLIRDYRRNTLDEQLRRLQSAVRSVTGCEDVVFETSLFEDEFWNAVDNLVESLDQQVQPTKHTIQPPLSHCDTPSSSDDSFGSKINVMGDTHFASDMQEISATTTEENAIRLKVHTPVPEHKKELLDYLGTTLFETGMERIQNEIRHAYGINDLIITSQLLHEEKYKYDDSPSELHYSNTRGHDETQTENTEGKSQQTDEDKSEAGKMATTPESESINEDDIDVLTMPKAIKLCRQHHISLAKELDKMKWLLKNHLLCQGKRRDEAMEFLSTSGENDKTRREALSTLYENTIRYAETLQNVNDPVIEELNRMFPDVSDSLNRERVKMISDIAPVLVLGETGSGKSSFINLLLGQSILPCSLLSNTHVICEIRYCGDGNNSSAQLLKAGSGGGITEITDDGDGKFTEELAKHIQELDSNKRAVYRLARIYLPCQILKSGLMIVDSPGIGETKEMTDMVLGYILNASAFIYIIDSTNAGGMQSRVKDLVQKVYRKALEEQKICRPESAIFVCNKWDEVCSGDRSDVWEDTKRKIKDAWPECEESQIIRFSTVEAVFIQDKGGVAPKFELILENINSLVPVGQEVLVLKGYRFIEQFISRCILCFKAHLSQLKLSKDEREDKRRATKERLDQLKSRITSFFDEQSKNLKADIDLIADNLKEFINEKSNLEKVCSFSESELPKTQNWNNAAVEVRHKVYGSLRNLIKTWEASETQFGHLAKEIEDNIESEFPAFDMEIYQAEKQMSYNGMITQSKATEESELGLVPELIQNRLHSLSRGTRVALGIGLAPVLLVGMIFRLPVYGVQAFDRFYSKYSLEKEFIEAREDKEKLREVCQKYATKTVASITDKMNMRQIIEEDMHPLTKYLRQQQTRMEKQIQCDLDLLKNLKDEDRKDEDIKRVYDPLSAKFEILRECLQHFMLIHLPAKFASWIEEIPYGDIEVGDELVCSGLNADVFQAKAKPSSVTNHLDTVCIRAPKDKIKESKMKHFLQVLEAYKTIKRDAIAICFGFWNPGVGQGKLYQILEPLQCSLRQFADNVDFKANHDNNCVRMVSQIVGGLEFLHDRKLIHFDLSMDTVAIGTNGNVKLTNISPEMRVNLEPKVTDGKVCISKYIHLAPKFFQNKDRVTYRVRDDMYGVGIIMWELWAGQPLVEIGKEFEIPDHYLKMTSTSTTCSGSKPGSAKNSSSDLERSSSPGSLGKAAGIRKPSKSRKGSRGSTKSKKEDSEDDDPFEWIEDETWFQKYLETFRPEKSETFVAENDAKRDELCKEWWGALSLCLDENISAKEWMECWKDFPNFPPVSIHFQERYFCR